MPNRCLYEWRSVKRERAFYENAMATHADVVKFHVVKAARADFQKHGKHEDVSPDNGEV